MIFVKLLFQSLQLLSSRLASKAAFYLFQIPWNKKMRPGERAFYYVNEPALINTSQGQVNYYCLGPKTGHLVLLVHGWESNAGSMKGIANSLIEQGYRVVWFDLPAHGNDLNKRCNLKSSRAYLESIIKHEHIISGEFSVVAHSLGSLIASYTLAQLNLSPKKLVLLTFPKSFLHILDQFAQKTGANNRVINHIVARAEKLLGHTVDSLHMAQLISNVAAEKTIIIHDEDDRVFPIEHSIELTPRCQLIRVTGTGHYKMLWSDQVLQTLKQHFPMRAVNRANAHHHVLTLNFV